MRTTKIGIVGCGNISGIYFRNGQRFRNIEVVACADAQPERAQAKAAEFNVPKVLTLQQLLADPEIDIVLNLTFPRAHFDVTMAAIEAGKHVYTEKPLATNRADGQKIMEAANAKGLRIGSAPDTFLGGAHQTCRKIIDDSIIGEPVGATAFMLCHGHENWHPDPEFYYSIGGGPMLDMGPYYLTALVNLIGPIARVTGSTRITYPERTVTSQPKAGKVMTVETPTHINGVFDFANGAVGTIITTFDVWHSTLPWIEVYGTEGSMLVPDPNGFGGEVRIRLRGENEWRVVPPSYGFLDQGRGLGVADMAAGIELGYDHRASGALAYHVLEAMTAFQVASESGQHYKMTSTCPKPAILPLGLPEDRVTLP